MNDGFISMQWNRTIVDLDAHREALAKMPKQGIKADLIRRVEEFVTQQLKDIEASAKTPSGEKLYPNGLKAAIKINLMGLGESENDSEHPL